MRVRKERKFWLGFQTFLRSDPGRIFIFSQVGNDKELSGSEVGVEGGGGLTYNKRNNAKRFKNFSVRQMCFTFTKYLRM